MITLTREEVQQVLDALNEYVGVVVSVNDPDNWDTKVADGGEPARKAIETLRARLSAPESEPVAWLEPEWGEKICPEVGYEVTITADHPKDLCWIPLYTAPPQREWQGLTDEELLDLADMAYANDLELLQTLQAKLKEKNT